MQGHSEGYLHIFAYIRLVAEESGIFLISLSEHVGSVKRGAEMKDTHILLGNHCLQQFAAWSDGRMLLLATGSGLA